MDLEFLAKADSATLRLELAKQAIEAAKVEFEACKKAYDEVMSNAEEHGIPKAKLKRLTEERIQALFESGVVSKASAAPEPAPKRKPKTKVSKTEAEESVTAAEGDLDFAELANVPLPQAEV
jgi:cell division protein FtsN